MSIEKDMEMKMERECQQDTDHQATNLLEQALYQPVKNTKEKVGIQADEWSILVMHELLDKANQEHKDVVKEIGTDETRGNSLGLAMLFLFMLVSGISGTYYTWIFNTGSALSDKVFFSIFFGIIALVAGFFAGAFIGIGSMKVYFQFWKHSREGKKLFARKACKEANIKQITQDIHDQSQQRMNEDYYFQSLLKFDHMVSRIQKQYDKFFLEGAFNFAKIRETITEHYLNNRCVEMCKEIEEALAIEKNIVSMWDQFKKKDKNLLEARYQEFAKDKTPEMINVI
jgi:hypothetical protein